jgi:ABC-type multidrug transport system fused ATPase/permease subunit
MTPVIFAIALAFRRVARFTITHSRRIRAEVSSLVQETVAGISVAKTFRQEQAIYDEFSKLNERAFRINSRSGYVFSGIFPILNIVAGVGTAAIVYFADATSRPGAVRRQLVPVRAGHRAVLVPDHEHCLVLEPVPARSGAGERVFALIDAEPKVIQRDHRQLASTRGAISFQKVFFSYNENEVVLDGFSLDIQPGETLALVGHTGAGKSSIAKLIARFYEFQGGRILVDGVDIRALDLGHFRARLGVVTQTRSCSDGRCGKTSATAGRAPPTREVEEAAPRSGAATGFTACRTAGQRSGRARRQPVDGPAPARRPGAGHAPETLHFHLDEATASVDR